MDKFILLLIIVLILFAFLLFKINELQKKLSLETFNNSEYLADVQAIRTLSVIADGLQKNGYTVPGNLIIANELYTNGWVRPLGDAGISFDKHGGGFHMYESGWIRTIGNKNLYCNKEIRGETLQSDVDTNVRRNLQVDGSSQVNGNARVNANSYVGNDLMLSGPNTWCLHTPNDGRRTLYFGKGANDNVESWPISFDEDGTINCNRIRVGGMVIEPGGIVFGNAGAIMINGGDQMTYYQYFGGFNGHARYVNHRGYNSRYFYQPADGRLRARDNWSDDRRIQEQN